MPAPATTLQWATDATFTNGPATIPGTNTKVAPSAGQIAEGHIPQDKLPAQHENWWKNLVGQWVQWLESERSRLAGYIGGSAGTDEWVYESSKSRRVAVPASAFTWFSGDLTEISLNAAGAGGLSSDPCIIRTLSGTPDVHGWLALNTIVPANATITRIKAQVIYDDTGPIDRIRMFLEEYWGSYDDWETTLTENDDTTTTLDDLNGVSAARYIMDSGVLSLTPLWAAADGSRVGQSIHMRLQGESQIFYGVEIDFTDVGPVNV